MRILRSWPATYCSFRWPSVMMGNSVSNCSAASAKVFPLSALSQLSDFAAFEFAAQFQIPVFRHVFGLRNFFFLCGRTILLTTDGRSALPEAPVGALEVDFPSENFVSCRHGKTVAKRLKEFSVLMPKGTFQKLRLPASNRVCADHSVSTRRRA